MITLAHKDNTKVTAYSHPYPNELLVSLYSTDVVHATAELITLDTGGYFTNTTKARMNQAASEFNLGYYVYQAKGNWFISYKGNMIPFIGSRVTLNRNGIKVVKAEGELSLV